ncbi:MAG: histidine phosphatase family protein [Chloroflexi bacterium]|nr:histidine phosphatase family protein [Chloroflexota bacterium]
MPQRIYLARHGETVWNRERRYQGSQDIALNETGLLQAERLRERLGREPLDAVFASPLQRARITAETAVRGRELPVMTLPLLRERNGGGWEGRLYSDIGVASLEDMQRREVREGMAPPGGESLAQVADRAELAWAEVLASGAERALVVSHNGFLHALLGRLLGMPFLTINDAGHLAG